MMALLRKTVDAIRAYASHPDPRVAAANVIALLVASNQPFYPLYLYWLVSEDISPAWFTFISTPFFLAVPAVARKHSIAGRALLPVAGIGNTILSAWVFGTQSAVEIFFIPCVVIALLLFRPQERIVGFLLVGVAFGAFLLNGRYGAPFSVYSGEEYAALVRLNVMSAGTLTAVVALHFSNVLAEAERSADAARDKISG